MKSHLIGIALFTLIVAVAAFVYAVINLPLAAEMPSGSGGYLVRPRPPIEVKVPPRIQSRLVNILYDERARNFSATVEYQWNGTLPKPENLRFAFGLASPTRPFEMTYLHSQTIVGPFVDSDLAVKTFEWDANAFREMYPSENLYALVDVVDPLEEFNKSKFLVMVERNYLEMSIPLLIKRAPKVNRVK